MLEGIVIRSFEERDLDAVLALFTEAFKESDGESFVFNLNCLKPQLSPNSAVVAEHNDRIVAFGVYIFLTKEAAAQREKFEKILYAVQNPDAVREKLEKKYSIIEFYQNSLTTDSLTIDDTCTYFVEQVVSKEMQHRGIGTQLTQERIRLVKEKGAKVVFVQCYEGGHVIGLYEKLGFNPLLRLGPFFDDGNAATWMAKKFD